MMCFVPECRHYSERGTCRFFRFPKKDPQMRRIWIALIRRQDKEPSNSSAVCSCHFINGERANLPRLFQERKAKQTQRKTKTEPDQGKPSSSCGEFKIPSPSVNLDEKFQNYSNFTSDLEFEERGTVYKFHACKLCSYKSKSRTAMIKHFELHHLKKIECFTCEKSMPELHECDRCQFATYMEVSLHNHIKNVHEQKEINFDLRRILEDHHCESCNFQTSSLLVLLRHNEICKTVWKNTEWLECEQCDFKTIWNDSLKRHRLTHTPIETKWFKCEL